MIVMGGGRTQRSFGQILAIDKPISVINFAAAGSYPAVMPSVVSSTMLLL
jgi:hypothetical protein